MEHFGHDNDRSAAATSSSRCSPMASSAVIDGAPVDLLMDSVLFFDELHANAEMEAAAIVTSASSSSSPAFSPCSSSLDEYIDFVDGNYNSGALDSSTDSFDTISTNSEDWANNDFAFAAALSPVTPAASSSSPATMSTNAAASAVPDQKARRRAQAASSAGRYRHRKKMETELLLKEAAYLSSHLVYLRSKHQCNQQTKAAARWAERAMAERRLRRRAETQNEELRNALFFQRTFLRNLKGMLASPSAALSTELNLHQLLHSYCRLGASASARAEACESMLTSAKVDFAMNMVLSETESIRYNVPAISSFQVQSSENRVGATMAGVYAFDTADLRGVFAAAVSATQASGKEWPCHTLTDAAAVEDTPKQGFKFEASTLRFRNEDSGSELAVESRSFTCARITDQYCVMMTDCVDADELFPSASTDSVKQDIVAVYV